MFSTPIKLTKSKKGNTIEVLITNATLRALQSRPGDLNDLFAGEIQSYATLLSDFGKLHLPAKKSEIVELMGNDELEGVPSTFQGKIFDRAAILHMLKTGTATTFAEYSETVFIPYVTRCFNPVQILDIV